MKLISIDLGFSSIKVCAHDSNGNLQMVKFPSIIGRLDNTGGEVVGNDENIFMWEGKAYYLFSAAAQLPERLILPLDNPENLIEVYPVILSYLLKRFSDVQYDKCLIGLSLSMLDKAEPLLERLKSSLIQIKDPNFFVLLPQGSSGLFAIRKYNMDFGGNTNRTANIPRSYLAVNLGSNTADFFTCVESVLSQQSTKGFSKMGICNIAYQVIDKIFKDTGKTIPLQKAKIIVDTGEYFSRGKTTNYQDLVEELVISYFDNFFNFVEENFSDQLDVVQKFYIIGGGGMLLKKYYEPLKPIIEKHFPLDFLGLPDSMGEFSDAIGYIESYELYIKKINGK